MIDQIAPPQFDLYEPAGYYDRERAVMNFEVIEEVKSHAGSADLATENEMHLNESNPGMRAWNLTTEEIRTKGALFNMLKRARLSLGWRPRWPLFCGLDMGLEASGCTAAC